MPFILLQLLLRQREHLFAHQRWHRDLNPFRTGPLMPTHVATRHGLPLTEGARNALPEPLLGLAVASGAAIRGVAQHAPNRGSLPAAFARACRNPALIQQTCNGVDTESLLGVDLKHHPHHLGLGLNHFIERCRSITLPHVPIAERRSRQHIDSALLRHVLFSSSASLGDLGTFVFGDHVLKLYQQLVLRRSSRRRFQKDQLHSERASSSLSKT